MHKINSDEKTSVMIKISIQTKVLNLMSNIDIHKKMNSRRNLSNYTDDKTNYYNINLEYGRCPIIMHFGQILQ